MGYATKDQKRAAAQAAYYAKTQNKAPTTVTEKTTTTKTYATKDQKRAAAQAAYYAKKKELTATETKKAVSGQQETKKQSDIQAARTEAARDRRDQERLAFNPILAAKEKLTYDEQQTKTARNYSSIAQMTGTEAINNEDLEFFTKTFDYFDYSDETRDDVRVAKYYYDRAKADNATKEDKEQWRNIRNYINNKHQEKIAQKLTNQPAAHGTPNLPVGLYQQPNQPATTEKAELPELENLYITREQLKNTKFNQTVDKVANALTAGLIEGVAAPAKAHSTVYNMVFGNDTRLVDNSIVIANQLNQQDSGKLEQLALGAVESIGRMVPSQLVGVIAGPVAASVVMGLGSAQSAFEEEIKEGATEGKALAYAALIGTAEGVLGYFLGGIPGIKKGSGKILDAASEGVEGVAKSAIKKVAPKLVTSMDNVIAKVIKNPTLRSALGDYVANMGSEFVEESLQDILENHLQKSFLGKEDVSLVDMETLENGIMGALVAGILGVPSVGTNISKSSSTVNTPKIETATPKPEIKAPTETAPEATVEATPRVTDEALEKFYADAEKYEAKLKANNESVKGRNAVQKAYNTGKISSNEAKDIASNPKARAEFEIVFDTKLSGTNPEMKQQIKAAAYARSEKLEQSKATQDIFAKIESGQKVTAEELLSAKEVVEELKAEAERIEAKIKEIEAADSKKAQELKEALGSYRTLGIGLQFFGAPKKLGMTPKMMGDLPVAETATPTTSANAPATASVEAQENETPVTKQTTATETNVPTEPVKAQESTTEETAAAAENQPYKRPKGTMKLPETFINSTKLNSEAQEFVKQLYDNSEVLEYDKASNKKSIERAAERFEEVTKDVGISGAITTARNMINSGKAFDGDDGAFLVYTVRKIADSGDLASLEKLVPDFAFAATQAGQFIQSLSIFAKLTPEGQKLVMERYTQKYTKAQQEAAKDRTPREKKQQEVKLETEKAKLDDVRAKIAQITDAETLLDRINNDVSAAKSKLEELKRLQQKTKNATSATAKKAFADIQKELEAMADYQKAVQEYAKTRKHVKKLLQEEIDLELEVNRLSDRVGLSEYAKALLANAKTQKELDAARSYALSEIGKQTPLTVLDVIEWARFSSMLSGTLTPQRNFASNVINYAISKAVRTISAAPQKFIPIERRTAAVVNPLSARGKELYSFAWKDYHEVSTELRSGKKIENASAIINRAKSFESTKLNKIPGAAKVADFLLKDFTGKPLEMGDIPFLRVTYTEAMAEWMKAQKVTPNTISKEQLGKAREYAIGVAHEATFRKANDTASMIAGLEAKARKTITDKDASLGKRAGATAVYAFSSGVMPFKNVPMNILKSGAELSPVGIISGAYDCFKNGEVDGKAITKMTKGLTGTSIAVLGALLSSLGYLRGSSDDEKEQYLRGLGKRDYSFNLGNLSIAGSWIGPPVIPLFVGASIEEALRDGFEFSDILQVIGAVVQPVIDTSVLSGANDYIEAIEYNGLEGALMQPVANYFMQFSPSLLSAINKTFVDPAKRTTVTPKTDSGTERIWRYALSNVMSRTPGFSQKLPEYVDVWGRKVDTGNLAQRIWDNFFDITSAQEVSITPVDEEIIKLYAYKSGKDTIKRTEIIPPSNTVKTITVKNSKGEKEIKELTAKEITYFKEVRGSTAYSELEILFESPQYKKLDDDTKAQAIALVYEYASSQARMSLGDKEENTAHLKMTNEFGGIPREIVFCCNAIVSEAEANNKDDILLALSKAGLGSYANKYYTYYHGSSKDVKNQYDRYLISNNLGYTKTEDKE